MKNGMKISKKVANMFICMQHQLGCSVDQHLNIEKQHSFSAWNVNSSVCSHAGSLFNSWFQGLGLEPNKDDLIKL